MVDPEGINCLGGIGDVLFSNEKRNADDWEEYEDPVLDNN